MVNGNRELKSLARQLQDDSGLPYTAALAVTRLRAEQPVFTIAEVAGVKMQVTLSEETFPYQSEDTPVYAQIELADGTKVLAFDYGRIGTHQFSDGEVYQSWIWPAHYVDGVSAEQDASHLITKEQFEVLERADLFATRFQQDALEQQENLTEKQMRKMTCAQLRDLVKVTVELHIELHPADHR